ncbi:sensor domain-containing diguanylate cyclase [Pseudanabaena sp. FACHB-2040]|uniref:sensor domain-containing diguanylate cyclase n=1 Tax=Pseudanabaena sp. FACHB-2040 TaxID=2692859 RepID=UPI0016868106|nr:sensor domain-containing diguanylate cyclase [Pseudanabaena sp. FACHB-2040]MBD2260759.1 diguanylate cyclase [Pseudanabaena sp. FACHB-2040]
MSFDSFSLALITPEQVLELVGAIASRIKPALDLEALLQNTADAVRDLLQTDRVLVYRFLPEGDAVIAVESVGPEWQPLLGQLIYDPCFAAGWVEHYRQGRICVIPDVQNSALLACHRELLIRVQVQANLVVPVLAEDSLWALLIVHHCRSPRPWQSVEIELVRQVALQLGSAVSQVELRQQFRNIADSLPGVIYRYLQHPDGQEEFTYISANSVDLWEATAEDIKQVPSTVWQQVHPEDRLGLQESIQRSIELDQPRLWTWEWRIITPSGVLKWLEGRAHGEVAPNGSITWDGVIIDISQRKWVEAALRQRADQEELLRRITIRLRESLDLTQVLATTVTEVQQTLQADRVLIVRLTDGLGEVIQAAVLPPFSPIEPQQWPQECLPEDWYEFYRQSQPRIVPDIYTDGRGACMVEFLHALEVKSKVVAPIVQSRRDESHLVWGLLIVHACSDYRQWQPAEAELLQQIANQLAIAIQQSELYQRLQQANQELEQISTTDSLTQLANRRRFDEYLRREWQRLAREQAPIALILCDVDYFKLYNDTYGHSAGDACLTQIAQAISQAIKRPSDLAARYGGEEFAVVLPNTHQSGALKIAQAIRRRLARLQIPHAASPVQAQITLSFGIAVAAMPPVATAPQILIEAADQALYQAKAEGRNRYSVAPPISP